MMATNLVANADRHKRFFEELETRASILTTITKLHKNIAGHFATLEQSVSQKSQALDSEIEAFNSQNNITHQSLSNRENALPEIESSEAVRVNEKKDAAMLDIENPEGKGEENGERSLSESLRMYCRRMDSIGLMRFLFAKRKESGVWRTELSLALEEAVDTMTLVLDAIEDFLDMKKDVRGGIAERRRSCGILIQEAIPLGGSYFGAVATSVKERAVKVLERWRRAEGRSSGLVNSNGMVPGEVAMFLHTVVRFGVKDYFEKDFLSNLVMEHSSRRDIPKVAAALGLGDKMKDIINELVKSGKEIEAIYFAHESGLTDQFPPVDLLKSCLDNVCKRSINVSNDSKSSVYAMEDANNEELTVTKAILKCVEDLKLEQRYSTECLMKKIAEMEKDREERKKSTSVPPTGNPSGKRSNRGRGGGGGGGRIMTGPSPSFRSTKSAKFFNRTRRSPSFNSRIPNSSNQAPRTVGQYIYTSHGTYDGVSSGASSSSYLLGHNLSPATLPPQYSYVPPPAATPTETSSSYGQTMYSGYDYGALDPLSYPQYQQ